MTSKLEQKETSQANGAVLPIVPRDCLTSPERGQRAEPADFLGPDGTGVEVVVLESRANAKGVREEDALLENGSQSNESDDTSTDRGPEPASPLKETSFSIGLQVLFPFLLAGFGTVAAGMVLDIVQVGLVLPWPGPGLWILALWILALWNNGMPRLVQQQGGGGNSSLMCWLGRGSWAALGDVWTEGGRGRGNPCPAVAQRRRCSRRCCLGTESTLCITAGDKSLPCCWPVTPQPQVLVPLVPFLPWVFAVLFQADRKSTV